MGPRSTAWGAYRQITSALRERITGGEFAPGTALPSETVLCREYAVARNTLRRALDQLASEKLVTTFPGRGRVVADSRGAGGPAAPRYQMVAEQLRTRIAGGDLLPGDPLPSESTLARSHGVSRGTVRHALAEMEGAGLIETAHGRGRFVRRR